MSDKDLDAKMNWLKSTVGRQGLDKFMRAKINVRGVANGQYPTARYISEEVSQVVGQLVDQLKRGEIASLCDVDLYYAAGKRWPLGMRIVKDKLVDVWE